MTWPGPPELGRGVVVRPGAQVPEPWRDVDRLTLDAAALGDREMLESLVDRLHRAWVTRTPVVLEWGVADDAAGLEEVHDGPVWQLDAGFLFPLERLRFLAFSNNYDARNGPPRWWWVVKAQRIQAVAAEVADVMLPDGSHAWIDGGPRQALPQFEHPVLHGDDIDLGEIRRVPVPITVDAEGLATDQLEAVSHRRGPARIIAPAGSGKTRTLTARLRHVLEWEAYDPRQTLALAYNERAAAELRERLDVDRSLARTIHSLGWQILREARPGLELLDERGVRDIVERCVQVPRRPDADTIGPYLEALSTVRARLRDPSEVEASRDDVTGFAGAFEPIRRRMYAMSRVDHGEQVYGAIEALLSDPGLRARWQRRCRHLLVDEFQDLTPAYLLLIRLVASPQLAVFGVGDDDQVIYGFDGADPGFLIEYDRYFPGAASHALEVNYRCPPAVVNAATHLLSYNRRRIDKTIRAGSSDSGGETLQVRSSAGGELAAACGEQVRQWIDSGVESTDIAVLARVNAALIPVKAALVESGLPTDDLMGPGTLDRTTVRSLFAWIELALAPERMGRSSVLTAIRRPSRGLNRLARDLVTRRTVDLDTLFALGADLGRKQRDRWEQFCRDVRTVASVAAGKDSASLVRTIVRQVGLGGSAQALDSGRRTAARSAHFDDLVAIERAAALQPDPGELVRWLRARVSHRSQPGGITLSSVHRVKGMEWSHVIVFGADRGAMPHDLAEDIEEERRVFHVALTRAARHVVVMADAERPSPFLGELDGTAPRREPATVVRGTPQQELITMPGVGDTVRLWGGIEGAVIAVDGAHMTVRLDTGAEVAAGPTDVVRVTAAAAAGAGDPAIAEALRSWRRETSRRLGVPAYVVLHDKTIEAIAAALPTTEQALLRITGIGPAKLDAYGDDVLAIVAGAPGPAG